MVAALWWLALWFPVIAVAAVVLDRFRPMPREGQPNSPGTVLIWVLFVFLLGGVALAGFWRIDRLSKGRSAPDDRLLE